MRRDERKRQHVTCRKAKTNNKVNFLAHLPEQYYSSGCRHFVTVIAIVSDDLRLSIKSWDDV